MADPVIVETISFGESITVALDRIASVSETISFGESITLVRCDQASSDITLPAFTSTGDGIPGQVGFTYEYDTLMDVLVLPELTLEAEGWQTEEGVAEITLPVLEIFVMNPAGLVAEGLLDLPPPTIDGTILTGYAGIGEFEIPALTMTGGDVEAAALELPMLELEATGYDGEAGEAEFELPVLEISAEGVAQAIGTAMLYLPVLRINASGPVEVIGEADITIPPLTLDAHGVAGAVGELTEELPVITLDGDGIVTDLEGTVSVTLPMFLIEAEGIEESWEAGHPISNVVVMNLSNTAISEYVNFPFTGFFILDGNVFGLKSDGIYLIDGLNDSGTYIDTEVEKTGIDLGSVLLKRATDIYLKFRATGDLLFEMKADKKSSSKILNNGIEGLRTQKIEPGKGMKGRHLGFNIKNIQGAFIRLNEVLMIVDILKRRAHDE